MATITSILGGDLVSSSRSVINTNFQNLNTDLVAADLIGDTTATLPSFLYATNGTTGARTYDLTPSDIHGFWFDPDRSAMAGGRLNNGLNLGSLFSTFRPTLHVPQYGISFGWNQLNKGVKVTSFADTTKGSVIFGYNNFNSGQYNTIGGQANSMLSTGGFVAGRENVVGYSVESTARTFLVSQDNANRQVVVAGDKTTEFPVNAYVALWQTDGITPALSLQIVTAVSYSAPNTTITFDRKGCQDYNGNTSSWVMNVTTAVVNHAAAVGYRNIAHSQNSFAAGESNLVAQTAPNGIAMGKSNSISGSADSAVLLGELNSVTTGKYSFLAGYGNANTTFQYARAIGRENVLGGIYSSATGYLSNSRFHGHNAQASGALTAAGDAQSSQCTVRRSVLHNSTAWFPLYVDGSGIPPTLANNTVAVIRVMVTGIGTSGSPRPRFGFSGDVVIHRAGGTYTILAGGTLGVLYNADDTNFTARVTNTGTAISVEVNDAGASGKTIRWCGDLRWTEVSE